jgi:hypothetical protein
MQSGWVLVNAIWNIMSMVGINLFECDQWSLWDRFLNLKKRHSAAVSCSRGSQVCPGLEIGW